MELLFLLGKLLFGGFFVWNGIEHFTKSKDLISYAKHKKIPMARESVFVSGMFLLLGGFSIILESWVGLGIILLLVFMLSVTFMAHRYWEYSEEDGRFFEKVSFMKNLALVGALIMLLLMSLR
jgi:putative oxidoreductase